MDQSLLARRRRHDLLEITERGREWASEHLGRPDCVQGDPDEIVDLIREGHSGVMVPGIVRREEGCGFPDAIPVGFSSPCLRECGRVRVASFAPPEEILKSTSPYQVLENDFTTRTSCLEALSVIRRLALASGLSLGIWGSAGLEIHTGLPYTHPHSDLDLLVRATDLDPILDFAERSLLAAEQYRCRLDIEVELPSGQGISLFELKEGASSHVLAKSLDRVDLIPRSSVIDLCANPFFHDTGVS